MPAAEAFEVYVAHVQGSAKIKMPDGRTTNLPRKIAGQIYIDPYRGFALDWDTGGAIRAPGRCDVYLRTGRYRR